MNRRTFLAALAMAPWAARAVFAADATPRPFVSVFGRLPEPGQVRRVFAAGAPAGVLAHALAPDKLLGWPMQLASEARALLAPAFRDLPFLGRLAGRGSTMPLEALLALKPDLIVDAGTVDATYLSTAERVARQTGIPYALIDGRLADSPRQLREAGRLLGVAERGEQLASYAETTLAVCGNMSDNRRPRVYLARGADGLETPLAGSVNGEIIEAGCGVNAAHLAGDGGLARVSMEQLLAWAPEVIVTQHAQAFERIRTDPLWRRLPAVRAGQVYLAPSLPFGWLDGPPGVNRLIGVRWLFSCIHGAGGKTGWVGQAEDFYRIFYRHAPERDRLGRLLGMA